MLNLRGALGMDNVRKSDVDIDTKLLGCKTNVLKEDLSKVRTYSSIGSQQSVQDAVANSKPVVKKSEPVDIWEGTLQGLFS